MRQTRKKRPPNTKKVSAERQQREIIKLLTLWPGCPDRIIAEYVRQTLGCSHSRACIQEAKGYLGLREIRYEEHTREKRIFAINYVVCSYFDFLADHRKAKVKLKEAIQTCFGERTNDVLLKRWTHEALQDVASVGELSIPAIQMEARYELEQLGIKISVRQQQIL